MDHDKRATLNFKWMLGVCYGNSLVRGVKREDTTCDAHKENEELTINPYNELSIRKIKYRSDGRIYSDDPEINRDVTETLNLNCEAISLPLTRKNVLMAEKNRIMKKCKGKSRDAFMREYLDCEFEEYCTCDDYYQPVVEDFEIDSYVSEWCEKHGFEVVACEGDGEDEGRYEPKFRNGWY